MANKILKSLIFSLMIFGMFLMVGGNYVLANPIIFNANTTSNTSNQFSPFSTYGFQVNISNETGAGYGYGNYTNITFQLGSPTGTLMNYTNYTTIMVKNDTISTWYINFTQEQLGPAGTYNYSWFANTSDGTFTNNSYNSNLLVVPMKIVAVNTTNQVQLWFMNTSNNVVNVNMTTASYRYPLMINITLYSAYYNLPGTSGITFNMYWKNTTLINSWNNTNITLTAGMNEIVANTTGNTNFSANARDFFVNITTGTLNMVITGSSSITTTETGSVTGTESNNAVENDVNYSLSLDEIIFQTLTTPGTMNDIRYLNTGTRTYRFNSTGGQNWSVNNTGVTFVVTVNYVTGGGSGGGTPGPTPQLAQVTEILPNGTQVTIDTNTQATPQIMQAAQTNNQPTTQPEPVSIIWYIIGALALIIIYIGYKTIR